MNKAKRELCLNCKKPFVYWAEHWHCTAVSCKRFVCVTRAPRAKRRRGQ